MPPPASCRFHREPCARCLRVTATKKVRRKYDAHGRLIVRARSSTSFSQLTLDTLFYDRRDKIIDARTQSAVFGGEQTTSAYDGIGALLAYERTQNQIVGAYEAEEYRNDALGNVHYSRPRASASGMVNPYVSSYLGNGEMIARQSIVPNPPPQGAILAEMANGFVTGGMQTSDETRQDHNLQFVLQSFTRQYQGADAKLRAVQRYNWHSSSYSNGTWEEYGYDALGRRVFSRARRTTASTPPYVPLCLDAASGSCKSFFEYVVWDGDQVLVETRQPDGAADNSNTGQVLNLPLLGLDTPIGVIRDGTTRVINPNWRGLGESSVLPNGTAGDCGLQPVVGCATVSWPASDGAYFTPRAGSGGGGVLGGRTWLGTNVANGVGTTGFLYRRNRYYDPSSGRFTQEDPIGLAGGMNLYGFAGGDPINLGDPFGLCPWCGVVSHGVAAAVVNEATQPEIVQLGVPDWIGGPGKGLLSAVSAGFKSFRAFKAASGAAGAGKHWHHIVGQTAGNVERFGAEAIHAGDNLVAVDAATHARISGFYSSKQAFTGGKTVREWLGAQSFDAQREFGMKVLRDYGVIK